MFNFWHEYKKDHDQAVNLYVVCSTAYLATKALSVRLGLSEPTKDIFGSWGIEGFLVFVITFVFIAPYIRTYFKMRDSR